MKKNLIFRLTFIIAMIIFLINCKSDSIENTLKVAKNCKVLKSVNEIQNPNNSYKQIETIDYQYDIQGNLIKRLLVIDRATKAEAQEIQKFTYNSNGFLIEKSIKTINAQPGVAIVQTSWLEKYTYANDRLATAEISYTNRKGITSVENIKYLYDSGDVLTARESRKDDGTMITSTFDSKGLLIDYVEKSSTGIVAKPYTIQNGLVLKIKEKFGYSSFIYDENRQNTKSETYTDGKLNSYSTIEYNNALRAEITLPKFKGFPIIKNEMGEDGVVDKFQYFAHTAGDGKMQQGNESTYINQKNTCGLVTKIDLTNKVLPYSWSPNNIVPGYTTKSTQVFTYSN